MASDARYEDSETVFCRKIAAGEAVAPYARPARSRHDGGVDATRARHRATSGAQRRQCWISKRRPLDVVQDVMAKRPIRTGANGLSAFVVHTDDPGFVVGANDTRWHQGRTTELSSTTAAFLANQKSALTRATGFKTQLATLTTPGHDRRQGGGHRAGAR